MSKFVWSNDYRRGAPFCVRVQHVVFAQRPGLLHGGPGRALRDLVFCYHGQAIPKAEAGDLDNSPNAVAYRNAAGNPPASTATSRRMLGVHVTAGFVQPGPGISGRALLQAMRTESQNVAPNAMAATAELMVPERVAKPLTTGEADRTQKLSFS
ncbi:hypothetical protein CYMTET_10706 [Cymbomonas tetramitiformis]|uniref:Uncharacterized protein n=1 Tax=Cymbomonas tetramitiformis TaxID=36881 RepID=A0AAE0GP82_9CHLO|nr:hypothetical protein CYMTET_10706 [Cymbomonas tetramitiformis]